MSLYCRRWMEGERAQRKILETLPLCAAAPPDAEYEQPKKAIHVWYEGRFIPYDTWLARGPVAIEEQPPQSVSASATGAMAQCGATTVWLVQDGSRYLMYAGAKDAAHRRRDFASPYIEHAMLTAELWYGPAAGSWRLTGKEERGADRNSETEDVPAEDIGHGRLDLDGQGS